MAQFNLINTGTMQSNTTSGTGNKELLNSEIRALYDGNTTSSGITLNETDVLYLDIDLGFRVRIDGVNLFMDTSNDRADALVNVDFYYKDLETDTFISMPKDYNLDKFFSTDLPDLCTPQYIRIVISNLAASVYEVEVLNNDTTVSFGPEGNQSLVILKQTLDGHDELGIFNNSPLNTAPVNAYVMVDYQGKDSDYYIKLSDNADGPYFGLSDGTDLCNNDYSKLYNWDMGNKDNVFVNSIGNLVSSNQSVGYYTTPLFDMFDKLNNTFLMTDTTTLSGSYITYDDTLDKQTLKIRSSNNCPEPFVKFVWAHKDSSNNECYLYIGDMASFSKKDTYYNVWTSSDHEPEQLLFDRKRCKIYLLYRKISNDSHRIRRYDYVDKVYEVQSSESLLNKNEGMWDIDSEGRIWAYVKQSGFRLVRYSYTLATRETMVEDASSNFINDLSATKEFPTCWYTDTKHNSLNHIDGESNTIVSVSITNPTKVAALPDGGCWVVSKGDSKLLQYSYYGTIQRTINYDSSMTINSLKFGNHSLLSQDSSLKLWLIIDSQRVSQIDFDGNTLSDTNIPNISSIEPYSGGCLVHCSSINKTYQLNTDGEIAYIWDHSSYSYRASSPYPMVVYYDEYLTLPEKTNFLPKPDDSYWGTSAGWEEIPINGQKLSLHRYHQVMYKFIPHVVNVPIVNPGAESGIDGWAVVNQYDDYTTSSDAPSSSTTRAYSGTHSFQIGDALRFLRQKVSIELPEIDLDLIDRGGVYSFKLSMQFYHMYANVEDDVYLQIQPVNEIDDRFSYKQEVYITGLPKYQNLQDTYWREYYIFNDVLPGTRAFYIYIGGFDYRGTVSILCIDDVKLEITRSSSLDKVLIPKPVVIKDIKPQEFKNIYIKKDIPTTAEYKEYDTRLKCWWGNEEE